MLAATNFDNYLVLIFFGIALIFQILTKAAAKSRRQRPDGSRTTPTTATRQEQEQTDEERIRKFLEALGQPTTSKPPAPAAPRPTYQKPIAVGRQEQQTLRRRWALPPELPPLTTRPADLPEAASAPQPVAQRREARTVRPRVAEAPVFEVHAGPPPLDTITQGEAKTALQSASQASAKGMDIATMLRSTSGLRDAIILREIFGPPRSMQPLDLVGSG